MRVPSRILVGCLALLGLLLTAQPADASYTLKLYREFSESGTPDATAANPYATLVFTQNGANTVDVTVTAANMPTSGNFISKLYFNLGNGLLNSTVVTATTGTTSGVDVLGYAFNNRADPTAGGNGNGFKADGDGYFDVRIDLENSGSGDRFNNGDSFTFALTGTGLLESHVYDISVGGPAGKTGFFGAAHIQAFPDGPDADNNDDSGWYTGDLIDDEGNNLDPVPAPAGLVLLATAIPVLGLRRVLRRKAA